MSVGRTTLVSAASSCSARVRIVFQLEGYAVGASTPAVVGPKARLPSNEYRTNAICAELILASARAEKQRAEDGIGGDAAQVREIRREDRRCRNRALVVAVPAREIEDTIATDGAAGRHAELLALKEWIGIGWISDQRRVRRQVVIAVEVEGVAVRVVSAGPGHNVDGTGFGHSRRQIEIHGRDLKLLNGFVRQTHLGSAHRHRRDAAPIDREARAADVGRGRADNRDDGAIAIRDGGSLHTCATGLVAEDAGDGSGG